MAQLATLLGHPGIAYLALLIGIYGLTFACFNPRAVLPGAVGAAALCFALVALQSLAASQGALALIALGTLLMVAEFHVPFAGVLGSSGIAAFVLGSATLLEADRLGLPRPVFAALAAVGALGQLRVIYLAMRRAHPPLASRSPPRDM